MANGDPLSSTEQRAASLFNTQLDKLTHKVDQQLCIFLLILWALCIAAAIWVAPIAWSGRYDLPQSHLFYALVLGGVLAVPALFCGLARSGKPSTKYVIACSQTLLSALLIHLTGGRIETHFHIFVSLILLATYRRWTVVVLASVIVLSDLALRGAFYPQSVYGVAHAPWWLFFEHFWWIFCADGFLIYSCNRSISDMKMFSIRRARLEEAVEARETAKQLASIQNEMTEQTAQISNVVADLSMTGDALSQVMADLVANAQQTLAAVIETSTIAYEVRQTAEISRDKARHVSKEARAAAATSELGKKATNQAVDSMARVRRQMGEIAGSMNELGSQGRIIGEIVSTVDDLALQTNLLALNASLEAAKSGEHGKGFVIVAQEVKKLSLQSKEATKRIRVILDEILQATMQATDTTERGKEAVISGEEVVEQAKLSIVHLAESVGDAAVAASEIEISNQQQLVGIEQVVTAMDSVREVSNHTVTRIKELEESVQTLNDLGRQLTTLVARAEAIQQAGQEARVLASA